MTNKVCEMLDIEFPILAFSHCRDVVAAVTRAGGLGVLGATAHSPDRLDQDLEWIVEETGGKPFGVDILLPAKYIGSDDAHVDRQTVFSMLPPEHRQFIDDIMTRYDVPALPDGEPVSGGLTVAPNQTDPLLDVSFAHPIKLIASALGPPPPYLIERGRAEGVAVAALGGSPVHAERHAAAGADLIVAQGGEAGGHTGEIGTMVLVPEVVDRVAPVPVLAAGGIGNGRQMAAAMALGAQGVWTGSVWLTTQEAETDPVVKQKFLGATSADTLRSRSMTGKPARMLRTAWTDEWEREDTPAPLGMPLQSALIAEAQARIHRSAHRRGSGAEDLDTYFVGQVVGSMNQVKSATQVVFDMVDEYIEACEAMQGLMS